MTTNARPRLQIFNFKAHPPVHLLLLSLLATREDVFEALIKFAIEIQSNLILGAAKNK